MRWYDKYEKLGRHIDAMKDMDSNRRDALLQGIMAIIRRHSPDLLEKFILEFPLDNSRQRWYDSDPYLWLTINGLQHGRPDLLETVALYMAEEEEAASRAEETDSAIPADSAGQVTW
ncbi:hypothetical protein ACOHYD_06320 [Desulfobacterota bacterium M19]